MPRISQLNNKRHVAADRQKRNTLFRWVVGFVGVFCVFAMTVNQIGTTSLLSSPSSTATMASRENAETKASNRHSDAVSRSNLLRNHKPLVQEPLERRAKKNGGEDTLATELDVNQDATQLSSAAAKNKAAKKAKEAQAKPKATPSPSPPPEEEEPEEEYEEADDDDAEDGSDGEVDVPEEYEEEAEDDDADNGDAEDDDAEDDDAEDDDAEDGGDDEVFDVDEETSTTTATTAATSSTTNKAKTKGKKEQAVIPPETDEDLEPEEPEPAEPEPEEPESEEPEPEEPEPEEPEPEEPEPEETEPEEPEPVPETPTKKKGKNNGQAISEVKTPEEILEDVKELEEDEEEFWDDGNSGPIEPEDIAIENIPSKKFVIELGNLVPNQRGKRFGTMTIVTHPEWAPIGVQHFHDLVESGFYKHSKFFRVLPEFIAQFGINGDPEVQSQAKEIVLEDDPVMHTNALGTLTYATAGENTRTTQVFFNLRAEGNSELDEQGFAPFAEIIEGMDLLERINGEYGEKPRQKLINKSGDAYLDTNYPNLTYIRHIWEELIEHTEEAG